MREIFSFIFDRITDPLGLPLNPLLEYVILAVIGLFAYSFAYKAVGGMYDSGDISTGIGGGIVHWIIRLAVFVAVWAILNAIITLTKFVMTHWKLVIGALGGAIAIACAVALLIILQRKGRNTV